MLTMPLSELYKKVIDVQLIQEKLLKDFFLKNSEVKDFRFLTDFPKSGVLKIDEEIWNYQKHGLGYRFSSPQGTVIDIHKDFRRNSSVVDAHRLTEYLISTQALFGENENLYSTVQNGLAQLEAQGLLKLVGIQPSSWELASSGR